MAWQVSTPAGEVTLPETTWPLVERSEIENWAPVATSSVEGSAGLPMAVSHLN
jgi:hypothetical protein